MSSERANQPKDKKPQSQPDHKNSPTEDFVIPETADFFTLQRLIGNKAVQRLVDEGRIAPSGISRTGLQIQRDETGGGGMTSATAPMTVPGSAPNMSSESPEAAQLRADDDEKLARIRKILTNTWVGPLDESDLENLWESFGDRCAEVAIAHYDLWQQCIDRGAELDDIAPVEKIKERFREDVRLTARHYMNLNRQYITTELEAIGMTPGKSEASPETGIQQENRLKEIQAVAETAIQAKEALAQMRRIEVGRNQIPPSVHDDSFRDTPATFDPNKPPDFSDPKMAKWEDVKAQYDPVNMVLQTLANQYPLLYPLIAAEGNLVNDTALATVAAGDPGQARQVIGGTMNNVLEKISLSEKILGTEQLDDRDLKPVHHQLMSGYQAPGSSGTPWNQPLFKWAAEDMLSDHESKEFWTNLGLGTLAAAAFIVAEIATFGGATFFIAAGVGLGVTGYQVASSWEKYNELATAADSEVNSKTSLVNKGQVDAAAVEAVLNTAFAFLDVVGPAAKAVKGIGSAVGKAAAKEGAALGEQGAKAGAKEAGEAGTKAGLKEAGEHGAEAAGQQGAKAGAEQAGEAGAKALRPQDAANWGEVEKLIGQPVSEAQLPAGYSKYTSGGRTFIRREAAEDARLAALTVDADGLIQVKGLIPRAGNVSQLRKIAEFARPADYTQEMLDAHLAALRASEGQVLSRVDKEALTAGLQNGEVAQARLNMVKGNAAEVLSRPIQQDALAQLKKTFPNAQLHQDVRGLLPRKNGNFQEVLFTDNMIAEEIGGDLHVRNYLEVKSGPRGGAEATGQIFEWLEGHAMDEGMGVMVGGKKYLYDPARTLPLPEGFSGRIVNLQSSPKTIIAPRGAENLGRASSEALTASSSVERVGLETSAGQLDYLVRVFLESL